MDQRISDENGGISQYRVSVVPDFPNASESPRTKEGVRELAFGNDKAYPTIVRMAKDVLARSGFVSAAWLDPEDLAHSWYVELLSGKFKSYDPQHSWEAYVFGTLKNMCHETQRKARRQRAMPSGYDIAVDRFNPLRAVVKKEVIQHARQKIGELPPELQRAIDGQFMEGLSAEEAAAKEGISARGMDSRRFRGRERLRGELGEFSDLDW